MWDMLLNHRAIVSCLPVYYESQLALRLSAQLAEVLDKFD